MLFEDEQGSRFSFPSLDETFRWDISEFKVKIILFYQRYFIIFLTAANVHFKILCIKLVSFG